MFFLKGSTKILADIVKKICLEVILRGEAAGIERFWIISLVVGAGLGVGIGLFLFPFFYPALSVKDGGSWLSGFGTLVAASIALWFGLSDARDRKEERFVASQVYRKLFEIDIASVKVTLDNLVDFIENFNEVEEGSAVDSNDLIYLSILCKEISPQGLNGHFQYLKYFPIVEAQSLAEVAANIPEIIKGIELFIKFPEVSVASKYVLNDLFIYIKRTYKAIDETGYIKDAVRSTAANTANRG